MRILVMGAGGIGSYYGALLARAGHAVDMVGRAPWVDAVRRDGLHLSAPAFTGAVRVRADTAPQAASSAELVLVCVKSADSETAAAQLLAAGLHPDAVVMSFQNGVDNADRLQGVLQRPVTSAVLYVAVQLEAPGRVRHHGGGEVVLADDAGGRRMAPIFVQAGIATHVSASVQSALWDKLIINCAFNALSAIPQLPYGELVRRPGVDTLMRQVVVECLAVAEAGGVSGLSDPWAGIARIARTMSGQRSSTAQDLKAGKHTEIDHLNGAIVRLGCALGIPTPANQALVTLIHLLEPAPHQA